MPTPDPSEKELLTIALDELRLLHNNINTSFDNLRNKALALLAGEVAIVTFIFSSDNDGNSWFLDNSVPLYGLVIYAVGITLLAYAFAMFLAVISSATWKHPPEKKDIADLNHRFHKNPVEFLSYLKNEYVNAIDHCVGIINQRSDKFMRGVYTLSGGIIILVVVKYGGQIIQL
ncbi:MAG: hypothetical protein ABIR46_04485 [Candidatus Saccharimonadales bacterium]